MGKMRQLRREIRGSVNKPLAYQINEGRGLEIMGMVDKMIRQGGVYDKELISTLAVDDLDYEQASAQATQLARPQLVSTSAAGKAVAVVSVRGVALYDTEFQPLAFSSLHLANTINELAQDDNVGSIVLDIDSPGGVVTGVPEAGDAIFNARKHKKVTAIINPLAASAAYWIASQASEVISVPSGDAGSIGVFVLHNECSQLMEKSGIKPTFIFAGENKVEANAFEPLSESAKAFIQSEVNDIFNDFEKAVARGRRVGRSVVSETFGQGRTFSAKTAMKLGMVDDVLPLQEAYQRAGAIGKRRSGARAEHVEDQPLQTEEQVEEPVINPAEEQQGEELRSQLPEKEEGVVSEEAQPEQSELAERKRRLARLRL